MIYAICGQKGGSGKTTLAINLGVEWSQQGKRVLILDMDFPQFSASDWYSTAQVYQEESDPDYTYPTVLAVKGDPLKTTLERMRGDYDVILLDPPGRDDKAQRQGMLYADAALIVAAPGAFDAWALDGTLEAVTEAMELRQEAFDAGLSHAPLEAMLVGNKFRSGQILTRSMDRLLERECEIPLLKTTLHDRVAYAKAATRGIGVSLHQDERARREIRKLVRDIEERMELKQQGVAA